jgi:hypothetical protein
MLHQPYAQTCCLILCEHKVQTVSRDAHAGLSLVAPIVFPVLPSAYLDAIMHCMLFAFWAAWSQSTSRLDWCTHLTYFDTKSASWLPYVTLHILQAHSVLPAMQET